MSSSIPSGANGNTEKAPHVLIAGGGLAGLFLGNLLEKAGISYTIYERTAQIKPLGSIMCLSPNILPAFEQLGLYEELMSFSKISRLNTFYTDKLKLVGKAEATNSEQIGYDRILLARPPLYDMLFDKIPAHKIHLSKKLVSHEQDQMGVRVYFEDGTVAEGDILVGADGAHSSVRESLYKTLEKQGLLPKIDSANAKKGYISLVGTTDSLNPAEYPSMNYTEAENSFIIGDGDTPYTWVTFTVPDNKICWCVIVQLEEASAEEKHALTSAWETQDNQKALDKIRHFKTTYGTLGDLFDATPTERVSKVYFEDKLYQTWNHDRTVLIGDAAHKLLPSTGAGAVNALQDAVILANCLYDIQPHTFTNAKDALNEYKAQRFQAVAEQYPKSYMSARLQYGHTLWERILRYVIFNWLPNSVIGAQLVKDSAYRPQANFLPQAPKRGTIDVLPQKASRHIQKEEEARRSNTAAL